MKNAFEIDFQRLSLGQILKLQEDLGCCTAIYATTRSKSQDNDLFGRGKTVTLGAIRLTRTLM